MRDGEVLSGEDRERHLWAFLLRAWPTAAPGCLWEVIDNAAASEAPTVKGRPAMACGCYVGVKMNRYYELCVLDPGFLL